MDLHLRLHNRVDLSRLPGLDGEIGKLGVLHWHPLGL